MGNDKKTKSVVVIGGTGGIGFAIAKFYADSGANVVITGRDQERTAGVADRDRHERARHRARRRRAGDASRRRSPSSSTSTTWRSSPWSATTTARVSTTSPARGASSRMKLIGYTEVAHSLYPRMGAGGSTVLFGGLASERPYPGLDLDHDRQRRGQQPDPHAGGRAGAGSFQRDPSRHHFGQPGVEGQERSHR